MSAAGTAHPPMLRVAIDVTPLLGHRTGIGRFVEQLVAHLDDRRDELGITVVPFAMTARGHRAVAANQRLPLPARPMRALWERAELPRLEQVVGAVDVVHGTNYVVPPSRLPRLVSVHDLTALRFPEMVTPDVARMPTLLRRSIARGAHVHTDSAFVADEVRSLLGVAHERVHTIALGVSADDAPFAAARARPHPFGGRRYLLAVGTVEPRKAYPALIEAFAELAALTDRQGHTDTSAHYDTSADTHPRSGAQDAPLLVIAGADGIGTAALDAATAALDPDLRAQVVRRSSVSDAERDHLLAHCDAFVYPSRYEGFGLPPLEAMAAGRPVVATAVGSLPEVLGNAAALVAPDDPSALARALHRVLSEPAYRDGLVAQGRVHVRNYDWDTTARSFAALYRALHAPVGVH